MFVCEVGVGSGEAAECEKMPDLGKSVEEQHNEAEFAPHKRLTTPLIWIAESENKSTQREFLSGTKCSQ